MQRPRKIKKSLVRMNKANLQARKLAWILTHGLLFGGGKGGRIVNLPERAQIAVTGDPAFQ